MGANAVIRVVDGGLVPVEEGVEKGMEEEEDGRVKDVAVKHVIAARSSGRFV